MLENLLGPSLYEVTTLRMSLRGRQRLSDREGKRLKAYRDSVGVWTIGVGHTANAGEPTPRKGMVITADECDRLLMADLIRYEKIVKRAVKVPIAQHEFDAFVSICFNVEAFAKSTAMRLFNSGDRAGCAKHILDWNKPKEIIGRRHTEQSQFLTPYVNGV